MYGNDTILLTELNENCKYCCIGFGTSCEKKNEFDKRCNKEQNNVFLIEMKMINALQEKSTGEEMEKVETYKYVLVMTSGDGEIEGEVKERI